MKQFTVIQMEIVFLEKELEEEREKYANLCQIEMQGGEGAMMLKTIRHIEGKIIALKWVINDKIIGDIHK